ncbi:amidohydrolase [Fictibacillus sp. NPDC058756]|uniref:amidohydrolase n=1 Tax=Fictibacillus sp. NPDC058756 TaxID=3346625 RepID=UPI0036CC16E7
MNPIDYLDLHQAAILNTYHDLHILAEPSWQEEKTSRYLRGRLEQAGMTIKTFRDHYGFIAEISGKSNEVVALRADMDALVQEVKGTVKPNHSCGHDAHSTMVLYSALAIAASGIQPKHTLRFIFQPAEEKGEGALQMMKEGALNNVTYLFGVHVRPEKECPYLKASPVILHGSAGTIHGTIKGLQAHASRPKEGINVIEAAAFLVQQLKEIQLLTETPYSIKMTKLKVDNDASNAIPETAVFAIDARAQTNEVMFDLKQLTNRIMNQTMKETGATISWSMAEYVPAATKHEKAIKLAETAICKILGEENVIHDLISQGGEDFHFYTANHPALAATMVGLGCGLSPGLHHPDMSFNLEALIYGAKILTQTVLLTSENNLKEE